MLIGLSDYEVNSQLEQFIDDSKDDGEIFTEVETNVYFFENIFFFIFNCNICDRKFKQKGSLKRHLLLVHKENDPP